MPRATSHDREPEWQISITGRGPLDAARMHVRVMLAAMADQSGLDVTAAHVDEVSPQPKPRAIRRPS